MRINVKTQKSLDGFENNIVLMDESGKLSLGGRKLPGGKALTGPIETKDFKGGLGGTHLLYGPENSRWLLTGLGKAPFKARHWRDAAAAAQKTFAALGVKQAAFVLPAKADVFEVVTGLLLSGYVYDRYLPAAKKGKQLSRVTLLLPESASKAKADKARKLAEAHAAGTLLARDLMCSPGNLAGPAYLAATARQIAKNSGGRIKVKIKKQAQLEKEGFDALLTVGRGSRKEAHLIEMEYNPKGKRTLALVGKGITFDSGGISLKPGAAMDEMKYDMGGAAAVLGTFRALAELNYPHRIIGIVPTCENMPGGDAYRPGDIIKARSGVTIDVKNTDAEGRIILADGLDYAKEFKPELIIDVATLTGACVVALGNEAAAILGNEDGEAYYDKLVESGKATGERVWPMPMFEEYDYLIESPVADIKNTGGRNGGTITAAKFLQRFADPKPWVHVDIAGAAWGDKERGIRPRGGNGFGVRLFLNFFDRF